MNKTENKFYFASTYSFLVFIKLFSIEIRDNETKATIIKILIEKLLSHVIWSTIFEQIQRTFVCSFRNINFNQHWFKSIVIIFKCKSSFNQNSLFDIIIIYPNVVCQIKMAIFAPVCVHAMLTIIKQKWLLTTDFKVKRKNLQILT